MRTALFFLCFLTLLPWTSARTEYRLIDDTFGDPSTGFVPKYFPVDPNVWRDKRCGANVCRILPRPDYAHNGTWTDATFREPLDKLMITLRFQGTGISVYFILANNLTRGSSPVTKLTECNFTMDGVLKKTYRHEPTSDTSFEGLEYGVQVYEETGLPNQLHTLEMGVTEKVGYELYLNFDYANYTIEIPDENDSSAQNGGETKKVSAGAIAGGVVGGLAAVAIVGLIAFFFCMKRKRPQSSAKPSTLTPFVLEPGNNPTAESASYSGNTSTRPRLTPAFPATTKSRSQSILEKDQARRDEEIRRLRAELQSLESQSIRRPSTSSSAAPPNENITQMRQQVQALREQLHTFSNQVSLDEPPPGYTH